MQLRGNEVILQGNREISRVLSSMSEHPLENAITDYKEYSLKIRRDESVSNEPSEAEIAHASLWNCAMQARDDQELLEYLALSDTLGRFIIRVRSDRSGKIVPEAPDALPAQQAYEPEFVAPVVTHAPSATVGPVLPIV